MIARNVIHAGDALGVLRTLPDRSVNCVVTSPPYFGLRDYGVDGQLGLEPTPAAYVAAMVAVFAEVRRVLADDGVLWLNIGDSYATNGGAHTAGSYDGETGRAMSSGRIRIAPIPEKNLIGIPWRVAFGLQDDGWILRSDIIWSKPNPMPESVTDRPTKAHEYVFLLSKQAKYWYDAEAIQERANGASFRFNGGLSGKSAINGDRHDNGRAAIGGTADHRNARTVWTINTELTGSTQISRLSRVKPDDVSCGMMHIVAPDCPEHGGLFGRIATEFCGGRADDELTRMLHTHDHRAHEHVHVALSTSESRNGLQRPDSWDSARLEYVHAAILHSIESRRTGHVDATTLACTPFAQSLSRTDDRLVLLASFVRAWSNRESSILPDDLSAHIEDRIPHRNVDTYTLPISAQCTCQFYQKTTRDTSHFATMPTKLVRRCIVAGCPVGGVVLDPFFGSGTTGLVARKEGRDYIGIELNPEYVALAERRLAQPYTLPMMFAESHGD